MGVFYIIAHIVKFVFIKKTFTSLFTKYVWNLNYYMHTCKYITN